MESACSAGACSITWAPLSKLYCWRAFEGADVSELLIPADVAFSEVGFSRLHRDLHTRLLESDAAAAQRTETVAVAAARCSLRAAWAVDGWQGELAAIRRQTLEDALDSFTVYLQALDIRPAFSCKAACCHGGPHVPGRRAVAAAIDALQLEAEALQAVAGLPSMRAAHVCGFHLGHASLAVAVCFIAYQVGWIFLSQHIPGRQVLLINFVKGEQLQPMLRALLRLLCAKVRYPAALPWPAAQT